MEFQTIPLSQLKPSTKNVRRTQTSVAQLAAYLGMFTPAGLPNRRGFLERIACRPEFPQPNLLTRSWKKSEIDEWAQEQRRLSRAA